MRRAICTNANWSRLDKYSEARAIFRGATQAQLDRIAHLDGQLEKLRICDGFGGAGAGARGREEIARASEGPLHGVPIAVRTVLDQGRTDRGGHDDLSRLTADEDATGRLQTSKRPVRHPRQAAIDRSAYADHHPGESTPPRNPWDATLWRAHLRAGPASRTAVRTLLRLAGIRHRGSTASRRPQQCDRPDQPGTVQP